MGFHRSGEWPIRGQYVTPEKLREGYVSRVVRGEIVSELYDAR